MLKHLNMKIYGRVQMVLFRDSAKRKAKNLGLKGFVKNEPDGSVYIEAEGDEKKLEEFLEWCKKGPILARVEKIDCAYSDKLEGFDDFEIIW